MKKTSFFKLLMVGAAALAIGFSGCQNGPSQADFDAVCERVSLLEDGIKGLETRLKAVEDGDYVVSVVKKENTTNILVVTYKKSGTKEVELGPDSEACTLDVGNNGNWFFNNEDTGYKAWTQEQIQAMIDAAGGGEDYLLNTAAPKVENGYWMFAYYENGEVKWQQGPAANPAMAYAVNNGGVWILHIPTNENGTGTWAEIELPSEGTAHLTKIDILGWILGKGDPSEDISMFGESQAWSAYLEYLNSWWMWKLYGGAAADEPQVPASGVVAGNNTGQNTADVYYGDFFNSSFDTDMWVNYAWISKFVMDTDPTAEDSYPNYVDYYDGNAWAVGKDDNEAVNGKKDYVKHQVLSTLEAERKGILINVHPANADVRDIKNMELFSSKAGAGSLPIVWGEPELVTGTLTRAANSALYFVPALDLLKDASGNYVTYNTANDYLAKYYPEALYSFVNKDSFRSEYSHFSVSPYNIYAYEAPVKAIVDGTTEIPVGDVVEVVPGKPYGVNFNEMVPVIDFQLGMLDYGVDTVLDYYITMSPLNDDNEFIKAQFAITFSDNGQKFTVGKLADVITLVDFKIRVYKLGIDGTVFIEDVTIYPVLEKKGDEIRGGDYLITDENTMAVATSYLSQIDANSLDDMFEVLRGYTPPGQTGNMESRWQNITAGAKKWTLKSVTIDGTVLGAAATATLPSFATWKQDFFDAQGKIAFSTAEPATPAVLPTVAQDVTGTYTATFADVVSSGLHKAKSLVIQPPYAKANGTSRFFEVDKEYILRFEFFDDQNKFLSYCTVTFTPRIPDLSNLFHKVTEYWTEDEKVLMAYYKKPSATEANPPYFYRLNNIPYAGGSTTTYYNVYSTDATNNKHTVTRPYDGGYDKFGDSAGTDKQWIDGNSAVASDLNTQIYLNFGKIATPIAEDPNPKVTVVGLINQTTDDTSILNFQGANAGYGGTPNPGVAAAGNPVTLKMKIVPGRYLGVYDYPNTHAMVTKLKFDMRIMSALVEGTITGTDADNTIEIPAGSVNGIFLREGRFYADNYNKEEYSLFTDAAGVYDYSYVKRVEFFIPAGSGNMYNFENENGTINNGALVTTAFRDNTGGYIRIRTNNLTLESQPKLGVRVFDRYGRVKESTINFKVVRNN